MVGKALAEAVINTNDASSYNYVVRDSKDIPKIDIRLLDAYLTYYMHIVEPEKLDDRHWAEQIQNLHFIRQEEKKASEKTT